MKAYDASLAVAAPDASRGEKPNYGNYRWYALGVMFVVYLLSFIDRQIMSILAEQIKHDLVLDDAQLGFLYGTAFAMFYAVLGIPLGKLADSWIRGRLMAVGLALWSAMTILSGFSQSYAMLALARVGVGIGEASASPAAYSMLGDHFPPKQRALANSIYSAGLYVGMGLSLPIGGAISQAWTNAYGLHAPLGLAGWQAAFIAVGLPGIIVAMWVQTLREPARFDGNGRRLPAASPTVWRDFLGELSTVLPPLTLAAARRYPGGLKRNLLALVAIAAGMAILVVATGDMVQWATYGVGLYAVLSWIQMLRFRDPAAYRLIWGSQPVVIAIGAFGCLAIMTYGYGFWVAPFAIRHFGLSISEVGVAIGIPGAAASAFGVICGGKLSDAWKSRNPRGRVYTCMIAALAPILVLPIMFAAPSFAAYALLSPVAYFFVNMWVGSTVAIYQDLVISRMFGLVSATYLVGSTMVGLAIGPYASGKVATITGNLQAGVFSLLPFSLLAAGGLLHLSRHIETLERTKEERAQTAAAELA